MSSHYEWANSDAKRLWDWLGNDDVIDLGLEIGELWRELSPGPIDATKTHLIDQLFFEEWDALWKSGATKEKVRQWMQEKHAKLDYYRTLAVLSGHPPIDA